MQKDNTYASIQINLLTVLQWCNNAHAHHAISFTERTVNSWNNSRKKNWYSTLIQLSFQTGIGLYGVSNIYLIRNFHLQGIIFP